MSNCPLIFTKTTLLPGRSIFCKGHVCDRTKITNGAKFWHTKDRDNPYVLCQKCFGFWLSRYSDFDYDPLSIDSLDLRWEKYWDENWQEKVLKNVFMNA